MSLPKIAETFAKIASQSKFFAPAAASQYNAMKLTAHDIDPNELAGTKHTKSWAQFAEDLKNKASGRPNARDVMNSF